MWKVLESKLLSYKEHTGAVVLVEHDPLCVAIVTPLMERAQALAASKDVIFVESIGCSDVIKHAAICLLVPTVAGAVPMGVVITGALAEKNYAAGLRLLCKAMGENPFGGRDQPKFIVANDSEAERVA